MKSPVHKGPLANAKATPRPRWSRRSSLLVIIVAICLLAYSGFGLWQRYRATHSSNPLPSNTPVTTSLAEPDETVIAANSPYTVPANQPQRIVLPSINAEGFIQKVGIDQNNAIAVPSNIHMAGWFTGNDLPGDKGLSIIDGHVHGKYLPGIFTNLIKLKKGDHFTVEFGDNSTRRFEVVSVKSYPVDEAKQPLFKKQESIEAQLNLITCGGSFDKTSQQYRERVLVVSRRLP